MSVTKGLYKLKTIKNINKIKNIKKNKLNNNIIYLEELSIQLEELIKELKDLFKKINENKEKLKIEIQKLFTKLRNSLNDREDILLSEVEQKYDELFFKEDIIKESEKLPNKIKASLEKGKTINNDWDENNLVL